MILEIYDQAQFLYRINEERRLWILGILKSEILLFHI